MKLSKEQREGILTMLNWVNSSDEDIQLSGLHQLSGDRIRDRGFVKDQLLKVLLLDEYDKKDKELLNVLRGVYLKEVKWKLGSYSV